jgi:hypothetical protein
MNDWYKSHNWQQNEATSCGSFDEMKPFNGAADNASYS